MDFLAFTCAGFLLGLFSSGHCLGMCGPIAFLIGSRQEDISAGVFKRLSPMLLLGTGKAFTYGWIGLTFGAAGHLLTRWSHWLGFAQYMPLVSGVGLIYAGLSIAGWLPKWYGRVHLLEAKLFSVFQSLKKRQGQLTLFAGGMLWGFLPCPMVLVPALASAVSGGVGGVPGALQGFFMMFGFGMGTLPALAVSSLGGNYFSKKFRFKWSPAWSGVCLTGIGVILICFFGFHSANHANCH